VFLKACDEPASQLNPDRDKIFIFSMKNRLEFLNLLKLQNLRKCIMEKFFASIHTPTLVLTGT